MKRVSRRDLMATAAVSVAGYGLIQKAYAATAPLRVRNVVLVHGAYADASSWLGVIPLLQAAGLRVLAVQNPLTSFSDDVAATKRALASIGGPAVLAAHSYGGMVISEAGIDERVSALVYIAARAPDAGEDYTALASQYPKPPASNGLVHSDGYAQLSEEAFVRDFAGDLPRERARALYAVQAPITDTLFSAKTSVAAWRQKPSWYAVSTNDRTIDPGLQRFMAKRMNAKTIELAASHVSLLSQPAKISKLILEAANNTP
jgi:pimeloyl-ACP methyl ester carboxylesterase